MVNWKVPAGVGVAGAVISLIFGIAGGNAFGTVLLRALASALLAGGIGLAVQYVLQRFLPDLTGAAPEAPPAAVDILIDEEVPMPAAEQVEDAEPLGGRQGSRPGSRQGFAPGVALSPEADAFSDLPGPESLQDFEAGPESLEPAEEEEAVSLEAVQEDGLPDMDAVGQSSPSPRSLKAGELEARLDNVTQGQDPASLARAVRTFLRKDQEG
jgi:hypothetical protein